MNNNNNNNNTKLLIRHYIFCGFTCIEKSASDFPCLGLYILPEKFIKAK